MNIITGLGLNVWNSASGDEPDNWRMAIYPDGPNGTDSSQYISFDPTANQVKRYLEIAQDDDWWVYDRHPDFGYILWGDRV